MSGSSISNTWDLPDDSSARHAMRKTVKEESSDMRLAICLGIFLALQITAALFFKWSSLAPARYWPGFILGNLFGMVSILLLIQLHRQMDPASVLGITTGASFLLCQIALLLVFRQGIPPAGWVGIALILAGTLVFAFYSPMVKS